MLLVVFQNCGPFEAIHPDGADDDLVISSVFETGKLPKNISDVLVKGKCSKCHSDVLYDISDMKLKDLVIDGWLDPDDPTKSTLFDTIHPMTCQVLSCDNQEAGCCMPPIYEQNSLSSSDIEAVENWLSSLKTQMDIDTSTDTGEDSSSASSFN